MNTLMTWVDAIYTVDPEMHSDTGGTMSFGTRVIHTRSSKQKLNTKSSTEAKLVSVSEYLPYHISLLHLLGAKDMISNTRYYIKIIRVLLR